MKKMKRLFASLVALASMFLLMTVTTTAFAATPPTNFDWSTVMNTNKAGSYYWGQTMLIQWNLAHHHRAEMFPSVDGKFGPETANCVKAFQTWKGIKADGIVGHDTWAHLHVDNIAPYSDTDGYYHLYCIRGDKCGYHQDYCRYNTQYPYDWGVDDWAGEYYLVEQY